MIRTNLLITLMLTTMFIGAQAQTTIRVSTKETDLILKTAPNGRLYPTYLGDRLLSESDVKELPYYIARPASDEAVKIRGFEAYPASGRKALYTVGFLAILPIKSYGGARNELE